MGERKKHLKRERKAERHEEKLSRRTAPAGSVTMGAHGAFVPPRVSRSSVEAPTSLGGSMSGFTSSFSTLSPVIPPSYLDFIELMAVVNPIISDIVRKNVTLSNTGHSLILADAPDRLIETAIAELNGLASELYPRSAGVDGLFEHYFRQLAITGALSSEDVLSDDLRGVRRVALVPVRSIQFKYEDGDYAAYQTGVAGGDVKLDPSTYHYFAADTAENSPYAIPPLVSAIRSVLIQNDMMDSFEFIMRKLGMMGLVVAKITPPPRKSGEGDKEWQRRVREYMSDVGSALGDNYRKGMLVFPNDIEVENKAVSTAGAASVESLMKIINQTMFAGAHSDPGLHGFNYGTTETFARVVYTEMVNGQSFNRLLVKRRQEATYRLHLLLTLKSRVQPSVAVAFKDAPALSPNIDELADTYRVSNIIKKVQGGYITPDQGAQEMGYDSAADPERALAAPPAGVTPAPFGLARRSASRTFKFNANLQRYEFIRPVINLGSGRQAARGTERGQARALHTGICTCGRDHVNLERPSADEAVWIDDYLAAIAPGSERARAAAVEAIDELLAGTKSSDFTPESFADAAYAAIKKSYGSAFEAAGVADLVTEQLAGAYQFYRIQDTSLLGADGVAGLAFDSVDKRSVEFLTTIDKNYFSSFVDNDSMQSPMRTFLQEKYLEGGEGIFGRTNPATLDEFRGLFDDKLSELSDAEVQRIVDTSVARTRNWGHVGQLNEAGFDEAEVINGANPCDYCAAQAGKTFKVATARDQIEEMIGMNNDAFLDALRGGTDFPPFHPNCHCCLGARA